MSGAMEGVRGYTWATFEEKAREIGMKPSLVHVGLLVTLKLHIQFTLMNAHPVVINSI